MKFVLADASHEERIRILLRAEPMPGHVRITYEREPDFFHGVDVLGTFNQVVVAVEEGRVLGFGCRSVRPMFVNGTVREFGYLSMLRGSPEGKRRLGLARAYRFFHDLHGDGRCAGYLSTIIEGNHEAMRTLVGGRAGLPHYVDQGHCETHVIAPSRTTRRSRYSVRSAREGEEALVVGLLHRHGSRASFFPALRERDFGTPLLRDLPVTRFLIAEEKGEPCGVAAVWDQSGFKQHRIASYSPGLSLCRPAVNLLGRLGGIPPLPAPGGCFRHAVFCFRAVRNQDPEITGALLAEARTRQRRQGHAFLLAGCHERDPAAPLLRKSSLTCYRSRLFLVGWEPDIHTLSLPDDQIPYVDPAVL